MDEVFNADSEIHRRLKEWADDVQQNIKNTEVSIRNFARIKQENLALLDRITATMDWIHNRKEPAP